MTKQTNLFGNTIEEPRIAEEEIIDITNINIEKDKNIDVRENVESVIDDKEDYWIGMPEYNNVKEDEPEITATFKFKNQKDFDLFNAHLMRSVYNGNQFYLGGATHTNNKSAWYPLREKPSNYLYVSYKENMKLPQFPVYIISKGRWKERHTVKMLERMQVPYRIVVEPKEYKHYVGVMLSNRDKILQTPENFSERGEGSVPVRNWVWEHSIEEGHDWHWILDDNIDDVRRINNNLKIRCETSTPFYIIEDFVLRYKNIGQAGLNYRFFVNARDAREEITFNTRIYSCILIRNDLPHRWRGKYNEDTDLSLRVLKDGYCTCLFNAFVIDKPWTMTQAGGNEQIYKETDNRKEFADSLVEQHPDIVKKVWRYNRWHHQVDYSGFKKNKLIRDENVKITRPDTNEYGMRLVEVKK